MKIVRLITMGVLLLLVIGSTMWLSARPAVRSLLNKSPSNPAVLLPSPISLDPNALDAVGIAASPSLIAVGNTSVVTISSQITDASLIPNSVRLLRLDGTGKVIANLGQLHDDGANGDPVAGDKTFSIQVPFNESSTGQIRLQVSVAHRGALKRELSNVLSIDVGSVIANTGVGVQFLYPPRLFLVSPQNLPSQILIQTSPDEIAIGGAAPEDNAPFTGTGYVIAITKTDYVYSQSFSLNQYLSDVYPYSSVDTTSNITISNLPAYRVTFRDELGAGQPIVIVPLNGSVYELSYRSTYESNSAEELAGLNDFNSILPTIRFVP